MFNVTRRVSFAVVIALTVGWGIFFLLFLASSTRLIEAQQARTEQITIVPPSVKINIQVDKKIYRGGETILIAVRNDSRLPIWIQSPGEDCPARWWSLEQLQGDGETWSSVALTRRGCGPVGVVSFPSHTLKSYAWTALVPNVAIGEVFGNPLPGTYRIAVPYVKGRNLPDTVWPNQGVQIVTSPSFSIL